MIGRANDDGGSRDAGTMTIDDFEFWSRKLSNLEVRETGQANINFVAYRVESTYPNNAEVVLAMCATKEM